ITQQPRSTATVTNGIATLSVGVAGTNLQFAWERNGLALADNQKIAGATNSLLTIIGFNPSDIGIYRVRVRNEQGETLSDEALIKIVSFDITDRLVGYWPMDDWGPIMPRTWTSSGLAGGIDAVAGLSPKPIVARMGRAAGMGNNSPLSVP